MKLTYWKERSRPPTRQGIKQPTETHHANTLYEKGGIICRAKYCNAHGDRPHKMNKG